MLLLIKSTTTRQFYVVGGWNFSINSEYVPFTCLFFYQVFKRGNIKKLLDKVQKADEEVKSLLGSVQWNSFQSFKAKHLNIFMDYELQETFVKRLVKLRVTLAARILWFLFSLLLCSASATLWEYSLRANLFWLVWWLESAPKLWMIVFENLTVSQELLAQFSRESVEPSTFSATESRLSTTLSRLISFFFSQLFWWDNF